MQTLRNHQWQRLLRTNPTASAFAITGGGRVLLSTVAPLGLMSLGNSRGDGLHRGVEIVFFGTTTADTTFAYRLYHVSRCIPGVGSGHVAVNLDYLGGGTATLGTGTLVSGDELLSSGELLADTLTFARSTTSTTPKGPCALYDAAYANIATGDTDGLIRVYSPADNAYAKLIVPEAYAADDLLLDLDMTGAVSGNAMWRAMV